VPQQRGSSDMRPISPGRTGCDDYTCQSLASLEVHA
jgi:hypothetical protein